ncbi:MAG: hypothetical protein JW810_11080 [Sedimentisphaerales bacterium]|nr:hypothetical protein [Sedimentisphaerales bacterium]
MKAPYPASLNQSVCGLRPPAMRAAGFSTAIPRIAKIRLVRIGGDTSCVIMVFLLLFHVSSDEHVFHVIRFGNDHITKAVGFQVAILSPVVDSQPESGWFEKPRAAGIDHTRKRQALDPKYNDGKNQPARWLPRQNADEIPKARPKGV